MEKAAAKVDDPSIITTSFEEIANDPEIEIVVEVMGGKQPAMNYILLMPGCWKECCNGK